MTCWRMTSIGGNLVAVIARTVCRRGEVAGLQWRDVDLTKGSLLIRRSVAASRWTREGNQDG
jgi:integrase